MADMAQPTTPRMQALRNLANQLPVANKQVAAGQQASRDMQLQQAVKAAPPSANIIQAAQQTGAASAQSAGQQTVQNAQQQTQQAGQIGQLGLVEQSRQQQATLAGQQSGLKEQEMDNVQRLAGVSEQAKKDLYDKQMQFDKDELGRTQFNAVQLADYAKLNAKSDEELKGYAQQVDQLSKRRLQAAQTASSKLMEDLKQRQSAAAQNKDQALQKQLYEEERDLNQWMRDEQTRHDNAVAMWSTGMGIAGAAGGAFLGGPAGASAGYNVGSAVGGGVGSQTT